MASGISPLGVSGDAVHPCTANHTDSRSPLPMVGTQGIPGSDGKLRAMKSHTHIATLGKDLVKAKDVHRLVVISDRHDQTPIFRPITLTVSVKTSPGKIS